MGAGLRPAGKPPDSPPDPTLSRALHFCPDRHKRAFLHTSRMNRQDLQQLSRLRAREAKALLDAGNNPGSYYLMGYSVECAIKAAIAKQTQRHDFPNKRLAQDSYSHDLKQLLQTAGMWANLDAALKTSPPLALNWAVVKDWNETARYVLSISDRQARDLYSACTARTHGLLPWLKNYW